MHEMNPQETRNRLIIFARIPEKGRVKTRLAATIGADKALHIYEKLLQKTMDEAASVNAQILFCLDKKVSADQFGIFSGFPKSIQRGNDLGAKLANAFSDAFTDSAENVIVIGTDCPGMTSEILNQAFVKLLDHELVIGPATDGGYYLIGMKKLHIQLFQEIAWSTNVVFSQTLFSADRLGLSLAILPELSDIDLESDLIEWEKRNGPPGYSDL